MQRLEVSGAVRPLYWSLGVKGLMTYSKTERQRKVDNPASHSGDLGFKFQPKYRLA